MSQPFGAVYADSYDLFYQEKDYTEETRQLESIFKTYNTTVHSILDLGCGTGNHAFPLAQRGYEVVGVDRSAPMLARARSKLLNTDLNGRLVFQHADIGAVNLGKSFDVVLMMFAVLGYPHVGISIRADFLSSTFGMVLPCFISALLNGLKSFQAKTEERLCA